MRGRHLHFAADLAGEDKWEQVLVESALDTVADLLSDAIALGESKDGPLQKVGNKSVTYPYVYWVYNCF